MDTDRDVTRIVQSWLHVDGHESADRVLDNVLALLDTTPQRRSTWSARRNVHMNTFAKLAIAAAAVLVVAVVGVNLLPTNGGPGVLPAVTASPSLTPAPTPQPTPLPSAARVFPASGPLAIGTYSITMGGVPLSIAVPTAGWHSDQGFFITRDAGVGPEGAAILFWDPAPLGVYADPCTHKLSPDAGPSTADLAAAVSTLPGTDLVSGPSEITVGGHPAKRVVLTVREDVGCAAGDGGFYLWHRDIDNGEIHYATALGETIRVWVIDVDGTRLFIEAESYKGAGPEIDQQIQQILDSISFE